MTRLRNHLLATTAPLQGRELGGRLLAHDRGLEGPEIESVKVDGDTASVTTANAKGGPTRLVKEDDERRVDFEQQ